MRRKFTSIGILVALAAIVTFAQWNQGVTGRGSPVSAGTQLSFHPQPLVSDQDFASAPTASTVDSYTLPALPAACGTNGCRLWVSFSYYQSGGTGQGTMYAYDGTSPFAISSVPTISNQAYATASGLSPEQFSSGATPTVSILVTNYGTMDVCAYRTPSSGSSTCGSGSGTFHSYFQVAVIVSN